MPPVLFVHGLFHGGWCYEEHFVPWFRSRGYDARAVTLRCHFLVLHGDAARLGEGGGAHRCLRPRRGAGDSRLKVEACRAELTTTAGAVWYHSRDKEADMNRLELSARCKVREGRLDGFKGLAAEFIRQTRDKDTGTLRFDWFLSRDQTECEIREEYLDAQSFMEHKANTAQVTQELFSQFADDHRVSIFGDPPAMLVERVEQSPMGRTVQWFRFLRGLEGDPTSYWDRTSSPGVKPGLELGAHMTVRPSEADGFVKQAAELLRLTREKDT